MNKRLFALLLAAVMLLPILPTALAAGATPGDMNADGKINGKDIVLIKRMIAGGFNVPFSGGADLNADGIVNAKDAVLLMRSAGGDTSATMTPAPSELTLARQALVSYAEAALARGTRIQYDFDHLVTNEKVRVYRLQIRKRQVESCTAQDWNYLHCAAFCHDVYYFALGYNITYWFTSQLIDKEKVGDMQVFYHKVTGTETDEEKAAIKEEFLGMLLPGDIVVRRYSDHVGGHALLYVGNNRIIHCTGSNYNFTTRVDKREVNGAIREMTAEYLFADENASALLKPEKIDEFCIVRPLVNWNSTVPQQSIDRTNNMRGVMAEKLSSKTVGQTVMPGEEITYTYKITNNNPRTVTLQVRDTLDDSVTFVSGCSSVTGDSLAWKVKVPAGETVEVPYTVRVKDTAALGDTILANKGTIGGVTHACATVYVGKHLTDTEKAAVVQAAQSVNSENTGWALAAELYDEATDLTLTDLIPSMQVLFPSLYKVSSTLSSHYYLQDTSEYYSAIAPTMFGGRLVTNTNLFDKVRTRGPFLDQLDVGDILVCTDSKKAADVAPEDSEFTMYMVTGEDSMLALTGTPALLTGEDAQLALDTAIGFNRFLVLRPSALRP